jgi:transposase
MARKASRQKRRSYSDELKAEAVQMMLDGHSAESVAANLGLSGTPLLYRWKAQLLRHAGPPPASSSASSRSKKNSAAPSGSATS